MVAFLGWIAIAAGGVAVWFVSSPWDSAIVAMVGIVVGGNAYLNGKWGPSSTSKDDRGGQG